MDQLTRQCAFAGLAAGLVVAVLGFPKPTRGAKPDAGLETDTAAEPTPSAGRRLDVQFQQRLDAPESPKIGDPLELILKVDHPADATARLQPNIDRSRWKLVETRRSEARNEDRTTTRITAVFQVFRPGETTLRPQTLRVTSDQGRRLMKTDPETIRIASRLDQPGKASFQGPRPPRPVWQRDWTLVWVGGGLLGLAAIALGIVGLRRRSDDKLEAEPDRPPEEVARERLADLADADLLEHGDFMVFYVRISEIVRRYLGRRYGFPGTEFTTAEILDRLDTAAAIDDRQHQSIADWLRATDLVKFSGIIPSVDEAQEQLDRALELIDATAPAPEEQPDDNDLDETPPNNPAMGETTHDDVPHEATPDDETTDEDDRETFKPTDKE